MNEYISIAMDYLRASTWRLLGAHIGEKARIGPHCTVLRRKGVTIGARSVLEASVSLKLVEESARFAIAENVFVGRGSIFDISGSISIGAGSMLAPGCFITDHNHGIAAGTEIWRQPCSQKDICIGADVWLGAHVVLLPGVSIGDGAVVAAGAVVTRDVAPMTIVAGVPARLVRNRT